MISSVEIRLFRGIRDCRISGLKTINIFIGKNNHGKSSILEALYLASGAFEFRNPWFTKQPREQNPDKISYLLNRRGQRGLSWNNDREILWYNYDRKKQIEIDIVRKRKKFAIRLVNWHPHPFLKISIDKYLREVIKRQGYQIESFSAYLCPIESSLIKARSSWRYTDQVIDIIDKNNRLSNMTKFMKNMMFIDSKLTQSMDTVEKTLWKSLLRTRQDKLVVEVLRKGYEIDVDDITYMPFGDKYQLAVKLPKTTIRVDDLGDGARYSMIWIMVAALADGTAILIEEPENHQHPSGLVKSLEMLLDIVNTNETQLFITTHSLEFIKLLEKIAEEKKIDVKTFFIEMDKEGRIESRAITPKDSKILAKTGLDMRFLNIL